MTIAAAAVSSSLAGRAMGQTLTPLTLSGWNQDLVAETAPATTSASAGFDAFNNQVYFANGFNGASNGLPANGNFVAHNNSNATFQIAPYTGNNTLLFNTVPSDTYAAVATSGILTLANPNAYTNLAFLSAATNNKTTDIINYTLNFADGSSTTGTFAGKDWYYTTATSYAIGISRVSRGSGAVDAGTNFRLWEDDIAVPVLYQTKVLTSIALSTAGTGYAWGLYGVSGAVNGAGTGTLIWNGDKSSTWDTTTANWQGNAVFADFNSAIFDDSATGSTAVVVQAAGVRPSQLAFNNSNKNYSFTGGSINASSAATFTGTGTVTFGNNVTINGGVNIGSGSLVVGSAGSVNTSSITLPSSASVTVQQGGLLTGVNGAGIALTGSGLLNVAGTVVPLGTGTNFNGALAGTGGLNISAGIVTVQSASTFNMTGPISVGTTSTSTAQLVIADGSNPVGVVNGTPVTVTVAGTGPSGLSPGTTQSYGTTTGAFHGADGTNVTFAGNVVIAPAGGSVSGGSGGTLTITGNVSGSGPVAYSTNGVSTTVLSGNNTNTGEVRFGGDNFLFDTSYLQLGNHNGLGSGGINLSASAGQAQLDLRGFNQSSAYLIGGGTTTVIQNSGPNPSVLTISNGNTSTGGAIFASQIIDGGQPISLVKTGLGNQTLSASNTYSGGTNISGGTLTLASSQAAGSGPITLSGGTLRLATGAGNQNGFSGLQTNNGATVSNDVLTLTSNSASQARSAFTTVPAILLNSLGFNASFVYTPSGGADGFTFTIENDGRGAAAVGGAGGGLAYGTGDGGTPIGNSISVEFNLYGDKIGFGTNGNVSTPTSPFTGKSVYVLSGHTLNVALSYNGSNQTLTETLADRTYTTNNTATFTYTGIDLNAILGGQSGYVGFTGATGGVSSTQTISNFQFSAGGLTSPININNSISTQAGTSSTINASVATGLNLSTVGPITIAGNSTLAVTSTASTPGTRLVLSTQSLTVAPTGRLDVTQNDLVLPNTDLATASAMARTGQVGNFTGVGITSSTATADSTHTMAVAVISNNYNGSQLYGNGQPLGLFDGANPGYGDTLVKYTYFGDANADGKVDGSDYTRIDFGYLTAGSTGWANGDFNYDNAVDGSDYSLIDNAYNRQGVKLSSAALVASPTALTASGPASAVPEPTTLALLAAMPLVMRRRRR